LDSCIRCGACLGACPFYEGDKSNPLNAPVFKNELVRRLYKRQTKLGKLGLFGREPENLLDSLAYAVYESCTNCRRCTLFCPLSIDISAVNNAGRSELVRLGKAPPMLLDLADMQIDRRLHPEGYLEGFKQQIALLEASTRKELADPGFRIPLEERGKKVLYVPLSGLHTILPAAKIFHAANESWSMSIFDANNYGYLVGDMERGKAIAKAVAEEAKTVGAEKIVITECGHAYRVFKHLAEPWFGKLPFEVESMAVTMAGYIRDNRLQLDRTKNPERFTYHDPCQLARNGGVFEEPRYVLKNAVADFVDMTPNREKNWCCGGGGGIVAVPEFDSTRRRAGGMKAKQIADTGAKVVSTMCDNCKIQISDLNQIENLGVRVEGVMEPVTRALVR
jgi:Fe-S oxidoreductase